MFNADARTSLRSLNRDERWRFGYRMRPYLAGVSGEALDQRLSDIVRNIYTLTPAGKSARSLLTTVVYSGSRS